MKTENPITPVFGTDEEARVAPKYEMPEGMMPGEVAYQIVHDEAMLDGNSRLNLATFVTTWMDDYARKVMTENMDKNMIDKTEYPQTAEIERRCVNILPSCGIHLRNRIARVRVPWVLPRLVCWVVLPP